jgi:hypothetical protein
VPNRIRFDPLRIMRTDYMIDSFQKSYFVLDSFDELFGATRRDFVAIYDGCALRRCCRPNGVDHRPRPASRHQRPPDGGVIRRDGCNLSSRSAMIWQWLLSAR